MKVEGLFTAYDADIVVSERESPEPITAAFSSVCPKQSQIWREGVGVRMSSGSEEDLHLRLIDFCITQL